MIEQLNTLIDEYLKIHPNATNPKDWLFVAGPEYIIDKLKKANGRQLVYVLANDSVFDGGYIKYVEN
jgi:hypothetical protein